VRASIALACVRLDLAVWKDSSATLMVRATDEFLRRFRDSFVPGG
jgi:hypothetical protein